MNRIATPRRTSLMVLGDIVAYLFSLILTLTVRYGELPGRNLVYQHLVPFMILFAIFVLVGLTIGLYDKQAAFVRRSIIGIIVQTQIVNVIFGVMFFYLAPVIIAPKANLAIYFVISTIALYVWRGIMFPVLVSGRKQVGVMLGTGIDVEDLYAEINTDGKYGLFFKEKIPPDHSSPEKLAVSIQEAMTRTRASVLVADLHNPAVEASMQALYKLIFAGVQVVDAADLYATVFDRIPLSLVGERWLVENSVLAVGKRRMYDVLKRAMDIVLSVIVGLISLIFYPFVALAIKLEDRGPLFVFQVRVGMNGKPIKIAKFRSMTSNDAGAYGEAGRSVQRVTRVGKIIRLTRIDELPQIWSVINGSQSLIGPRPELPALVSVYEKEIPYYSARHLIKPGLSGWAQIYHKAHPHHAVAVEDTRGKLSYDLFYVRNRSLSLDLKIALQTFRALISRQGV